MKKRMAVFHRILRAIPHMVRRASGTQGISGIRRNRVEGPFIHDVIPWIHSPDITNPELSPRKRRDLIRKRFSEMVKNPESMRRLIIHAHETAGAPPLSPARLGMLRHALQVDSAEFRSVAEAHVRKAIGNDEEGRVHLARIDSAVGLLRQYARAGTNPFLQAINQDLGREGPRTQLARRDSGSRLVSLIESMAIGRARGRTTDRNAVAGSGRLEQTLAEVYRGTSAETILRVIRNLPRRKREQAQTVNIPVGVLNQLLQQGGPAGHAEPREEEGEEGGHEGHH
ncbi:MAG: hypothetical protein V1787_03430 [Candidatus Micrarchaeota archaeon]